MYSTEVYDAAGETIATVAWYPVKTKSGSIVTAREANASLIAAAPDLLAVAICEEALDMPALKGDQILERYGWRRADRFDLPATKFVANMRRAAIAKASGQELATAA
jgi:hypothetical protein